MKKNISKKQILDVTLELIDGNRRAQDVTLHEIARVLGCAHTNLYNYFSGLNELLWETYVCILDKFLLLLTDQLDETQDCETKLQRFFSAFLDMYLNHKGWFQLVWIDAINDTAPEYVKAATERTVDHIAAQAGCVWVQLHQAAPNKVYVRRVLHNTHCYIIGEVSNFISGRGLYSDEKEFKEYVARTAAVIFTLCLKEAQ